MNFSFNRRSKEEKAAARSQTQLVDLLRGQSERSWQTGSALLPDATDNWDDYESLLKGLLGMGGGEGGATMESMRYLGPAVTERKRQTQGLLRQADFAPRGGGRGESLFNLYSDEARDIGGLLANLRLHALGELPKVGDRRANLGTSLISGSSSAGAQAGGINGGLLSYHMQDRQQRANQIDELMKMAAMFAGGA